ncbi:hypothetical protein COCNU_11G000070 [Cocos nucifera]|uniref:CBS domain-containing protein n=1 Tax=Cocos nucifera TaxID=13894 RepID=A0A8K0INC9_COCNU|nr:hypothetical protein COCNU_11G000070 [Cocos nucifera]
MIVESDKATGAVRKHYIGMVTMLDILAHIAEEDHVGHDYSAAPTPDLDVRMAVPVSSIIGHSLEGLSLWTLNPNTSILDCMESFSKEVHRAPVPLESHADHVIAGRGKRLVDTFSATDLEGCPIALLQSWLSTSIMEFKERVSMRETAAPHPHRDAKPAPRKLITCDPGTSLAQVMEEMVEGGVHRVWVVDPGGSLVGLVSLTDMLRVIRASVIGSFRADLKNGGKEIIVAFENRCHMPLFLYRFRCSRSAISHEASFMLSQITKRYTRRRSKLMAK